ncbi:MAG: dihydroneopterin aldolase [Bacteroidales bacterium]|nr:dihydroneopterin aldolase [Bacteroidales bacterium]
MKSYIEIDNLQLQAFHGVLEQEHSVGNLYRIDCKIEVDVTRAMESDELTDTVSYADVVSIIQKEMQLPSKLLEHVAGRIVSQIRQQYGQQVQGIDLRIAKLCPPIGHAQVEACALHIII